MDDDRSLSAFNAAEHVQQEKPCGAYISFKGMSRKGAKARPLFQFPSLRVNAEDIKMRKKRTEVPALIKVQIGEALKRGIPVGKLARDFNVDTKTVYRCGQALEASREAVANGKGTRTRNRGGNFDKIDAKVLEMILRFRQAGYAVSKRAIEMMGKKVYGKMVESGEMEKDIFTASAGWAMNLIRRNGLKVRRLHGEAADAKVIAHECENAIRTLQQELRSYDLSNIYNMDETGLFFRCLPKQSYVLPCEDTKTTRGGKNMSAKDRITLLVCTNAAGDRCPLTIIGTSATPACFRVRNVPKHITYLQQDRAWSDSRTMSQWFHFHFLPFVRKQNSKRVALILDNAPSHAINLVDAEGQVKIFNLPENTTSIYQPMDAGIIAALKTRYKYDLLVEILARLDEAPLAREATKDWKKGTRGLQEGMKPNILCKIPGR